MEDRKWEIKGGGGESQNVQQGIGDKAKEAVKKAMIFILLDGGQLTATCKWGITNK